MNSSRTTNEFDKEIASRETEILELQKKQEEQVRAELEKLKNQRDDEFYNDDAAIAANKMKLYNKVEIYRLFTLIEKKLALENKLVNRLTPACQSNLTNLRNSVTSFKRQLLNEIDTRNDDFPVRTAQKLHEAVCEVFDPDSSAYKKNAAINHFRNTARNAALSHDTKVLIAAILGGILGLAIWATLTVITGGLAGLITFAGLGLGALVITFGAAHFAARSDSVMRSFNPDEFRGRQVSDNMKTLLRHREELFPPKERVEAATPSVSVNLVLA